MKKKQYLKSTVPRNISKSITILVSIIFILSLYSLLFIPSTTYAAGERTYFRFDIPKGTKYSPGWHGYGTQCPKNVTIVLYNEAENYGIAYTTDTFRMLSTAIITNQSTADLLLSSVRDGDGIYYGQKLADRWLPEIRIETEQYSKDLTKESLIKVDPSQINITINAQDIINKKVVKCPVCGEYICDYYDGLEKTRQIIYCSKGHRITTASWETLDNLKMVVK
jgi:hypothetical protein